MREKKHLLIVDDDAEIRSLLVKFLREHNYDVSSAGNGVELFSVLNNTDIDLIVLDLMLPGEDGLSLCRKLRVIKQIPIIMLTAAGADTDKIIGLEVGADDYMTKPFSPRELVARIKAVLRRIEPSLIPEKREIGDEQFEFSGWCLDTQFRKLMSPDQVEVELSSGEYVLLLAFLENPHIVLSRDQLLDITHNRSSGPFDRCIDVQVSRLRQKIELDPKKPILIKTVRGGGYLFTEKVTKVADQCV